MADDERNIIDEEDAEAQRSRAAPLPIDWKIGATGQTVGRDALIQAPNARQLRVFQNKRVRTCGDCKFLRQDAFQKPKGMLSGFMRGVWEMWGTSPSKYLADRPDKLGRCAQDPDLVVGPSSLACDHYRAK